jgi:hypothetical protein
LEIFYFGLEPFRAASLAIFNGLLVLKKTVEQPVLDIGDPGPFLRGQIVAVGHPRSSLAIKASADATAGKGDAFLA